MKKIHSEIDPANILPQKRNRVTSLEGVWSLITTQIDDVLFSNKKKKFNKNNKKSKPKIQPNAETSKIGQIDSKSNLNEENQKIALTKVSKKIKRKLSQKVVKEKHSRSRVATSKKIPATPKKTQEKIQNKLERIQKKAEKMQLESMEANFGKGKNAVFEKTDNKNQKMKTIHIVDPKQKESYLKLLQEHLGLGMGIAPAILSRNPPFPEEVDFIKIED